jgi:hypothetical protein
MKKLNFTLLLSVFCTAFSFAQVPNYVPTNGLVGWWPFNGNANDESGNNNNGTVNGATLTTDRNGQINKAYNFDGNDYIEVNRSNSIEPTNQITYACWVFMNSGFNGSTFFVKGYQVGLGSYGYSISLAALSSGGTYGGNSINTTVQQNRWYYMLTTYDGNSCKLYIDGQLVHTSNPNGTLQYNNLNLFMGVSNTPTVPVVYLNGKLDDIAIWNRALTQQEVTNLYQGCSANVNITPAQTNSSVGSNAIFNTSGATTYQWQTNALNLGWQNIPNNASYSGATSNSLTVNNVQIQNHQQSIRVVGVDGACRDTAYTTINVADTCVNTVFDTITTSITVTDTLLINAVLSGVNPPNNVNTLRVFPNPARTHITIDNGNFALMNTYTARINNSLGQTVFSQTINQQQFFIDLSTWTGNGIYYLDILDAQGNSIESKVIVVQ